MKPSGYTLHTTKRIAVIATLETNNRKTGDMVQVWIIRRDINPVEAVKTGKDSLICGDCPHRGDLKTGRKRSCYVNVGQAPNAIYKAFRNGRYPRLPISKYAVVFQGRNIRFGAYGDPANIPQEIVESLARVVVKRTGYTHQWRSSEWLKPFVMASVDTVAEYHAAHAAGWRTFRPTNGHVPEFGEILCLSESRGIECTKCGLCNGASSAKSIYIPVHGSGKSNAFTILQ
jgi:hypothetical protein